MNKKKLQCIITVLFFLIIFCSNKLEIFDMSDIDLFKNTPAWDLVKAIDKENIYKIKKILSVDKSLANFQESLYGMTPLMRAIGTDKYKSTKELLDCGANPNLASKIGTNPLFEAISYRWNDVTAKNDTKYVKLLLSYGANPNLGYFYQKIVGETNPIEYGTSPLIYAIAYSSGYDIVRLLVASGAEINYKTRLGNTAAIESLKMEDINSAFYLIVENKAKIVEPYFYYNLINDTVIDKDKPFYPVDLLLDWTYEIGSERYNKKKLIVQEFANQGVSYNDSKVKINNLILRKIKKNNPNNWKEYLEKY